jgi:hypothetical protein
MKLQNHYHLQEEQILWAVIDEKELAGDDRQHLLECRVCKKKVEQFGNELQKFGQEARQTVPPFSRPVKLPKEKPVRVSHNVGWLPFFGAAAMAGFVVFFYFMSMETMAPTKSANVPSQESLLEDESLMREISEMVEYPLPDDMYEIYGNNGIGFDDDFLQFLVPDTEEDFQSELITQGGIKRC